MANPVTFQVSLAPTDYPHARHILPHQLRQWARQVDEVLCVVDLHRSHGRFGSNWDANRPKLIELIAQCCADHEHARMAEVDYSENVRRQVSEEFFGGKRVPEKDYRGGPFYSYFFGLHAASNDLVFHVDSDMMFGGGSVNWVQEAVQLLRDRNDVLACSVLPGPPTPDGVLITQVGEHEPSPRLAYRFAHFTSRHFMLSRERFASRVGALTLEYAPVPLKRKAKSLVRQRRLPYAIPENIVGSAMRKDGLFRINFLGAPPGMWSLHPVDRSEPFLRLLPEIILRVERNEIPEGQRGDYNLNESWFT
jgi:hypothetical protein